MNQKIQRLNESLQHKLPRTVDYYNDLVMLAENLLILHQSETQGPSGAKSALRIVLA